MSIPVLVIDFGSQVTQLIARRVREAGVYCEIVPFNKAEEALERLRPRAIILSGGPASVTESDTPRAPQKVFEMGVPVLGICYGEMTMCAQLGGAVESGHAREFGRAEIRIAEESPLLAGLGSVGGVEGGARLQLELALVEHPALRAGEQPERATGAAMPEDRVVPRLHLLVAALSFARVVKAAVVVPAVEVPALDAGRSVGEQQHVR